MNTQNPRVESETHPNPLPPAAKESPHFWLKLKFADGKKRGQSAVVRSDFSCDGSDCQEIDDSSKRKSSIYVSRIALMLLKWKEGKTSFLIGEEPWSGLNEIVRGDASPSWLKQLFATREDFHKLIPRAENGNLVVNDEIFEKENVVVEIVDGEGTLETAKAIGSLEAHIGAKDDHGLTEKDIAFIKFLAQRLRLKLDETDQLRLGKTIWLSQLLDLEAFLTDDLISKNGVLGMLVDELMPVGGGLSKSAIIGWNTKVHVVIQRLVFEFSRCAECVGFRTSDVVSQLHRLQQKTVELAQVLPCEQCEPTGASEDGADYRTLLDLAIDVRNEVQELAVDLHGRVDRCRKSLKALLG